MTSSRSPLGRACAAALIVVAGLFSAPALRAAEGPGASGVVEGRVLHGGSGDYLENARVAVQEGQSLGQSIEKSQLFPPLVTYMIMTGEKTGQLEEMLGHVSVAYDAEVERKVEALIGLIEPMMVIFMTVGGAGILGALMVPMLSIMNQIR